tara:strand:- start:198 stop:383 length:186 start_codon:yes stop_codon:yes gene_type:complete
MKLLYILILVFVYSCGYPDIDSVPDFENLVITEEESIDLCKLRNTDKELIEECLNKIKNNN